MTPHCSRNTFTRRYRPLRRLGETDNKIVIIIVLCVLGALSLVACVPVIAILAALLLPAVQQAREAARRTESRDNLHNIALATHNFHDVEGHWVGGTTRSDGQLAHSWQTHLLPYMDQSVVYQSIDLDSAWDDPGQSGMFQTIIPLYHHPSQTVFFTDGGHATSHYTGNVNVLLQDSQLTMRDVTDGTSNTIAAGEVTAGFKAWGDPTNLRDPANGIGGGADQFGSAHEGGAFMMFMDGSVRFVSENIDPQVLEGLSTPNGGEAVGQF